MEDQVVFRWTLVAPTIITIIVAFFGWLVTRSAMKNGDWYAKLNKPPYNPPKWFFGIAWLILYIFYIVAWTRGVYLFNKTKNDKKSNIINYLFTVHIVLNMLWSWVFFGAGDLAGGLVILLLMLITLAMILYYLSFDNTCFVLMLIYFGYLMFAFALNWYIIKSNCPVESHNFNEYYT